MCSIRQRWLRSGEPGLWEVVRLGVGFGGAAAALLAVVRAPTRVLWLLAIGVTEWGHVVAALVLGALWPGREHSRAGCARGWLAAIAAFLALTPLARAALVAQEVPKQLAMAFGALPAAQGGSRLRRRVPLVLVDVLRGISTPRVRPMSLVYARRGTQVLRLDVYQPPQKPKDAPLLLVVHGGAWQAGDSRQLATLNAHLAGCGYVVAALNYRLLPEHPFPAAYDDVVAALAYLRENAHGLGIDARRCVLLGRSAGGQLALLVAYRANDPAICGVISFYGPTDLGYGYAHPANPAVIDSCAVLECYLGGSPTQVPNGYIAASPCSFVGPTTPPTLLIHGGRDEVVSAVQSERLQVCLTEAQRPHLFVRLPWATHGCDAHFSGPSGQISTYAIEYFLAVVTQ